MGTSFLTVFGKAALAQFAKKHALARKPLARFLELARDADWNHLPAVKESFPGTDYAADSQTYIFNIGGNRYRLLAGIDFESQILTIEAVMTHEQYNRKEL